MKKVFDVIVEAGEKKRGKVLVGHNAYSGEVTIPVLILCGNKAGPTLWINGAIHGDELNGPVASWEIFNELSPDEIEGNIIITPISNPLAFENRSKVSDVDLLDMDTSFPGDPDGLFTQRVSYKIFQEIKEHASYLLNFHTLSTPFRAVPYTVSKVVPKAEQDTVTKSRNMAIAFGLETNCSVDLASAAGELPGVTNGALDITCIQNGIPAFMAEVGSGGVVDDKYVSIAKTGIINLLVHLGMMDGNVKRTEKQYMITKRKFLRSNFGGLVTVVPEPGQIVSSGEKLTDTHFFGNDMHSTSLKEDSYVIATRVNPVVNTGDRLAFVGTEWEEVEK